MSSSRIAISMGDPAGIGPEVVVRACAALDEDFPFEPVVYGDANHLGELADELRLPPPRTVACGSVEPGLEAGRPRAADGRLALDSIMAAADAAERGDATALVTAPVSKRVIAAIEPGFKGHTEYLAARAGAANTLMIFAGIRPSVALLTTHLPLTTAIASVRKDRIVMALQRLDAGWRRWFGAPPRIAVAALNPHAGENGLLGSEDDLEVRPATAEARRLGVQVSGPLPADSIFRTPDIDVVLALYHDQGTIMAKGHPTPSVNTTFGLPYPRTSPDHGVAYDIAARRVAHPGATIAAIRLAAQMGQNRS
jgi:4-hydroxythreonine-4-phosphate dehydrogenase